MPGPLGPTGPTTDPNWAWDTPGWTNQGNTSDVEGQNLGSPGQGSMLVEPAVLSGYITRSFDPDVTTAGGTGTTLTLTLGTVFLIALQVLEPTVTTKIVVPGKTAGSSLHAYAGLYNAVSGQQVAITADLTTFGTTTAAKAWTAATAIAPGYYWAALLEVGGTNGTVQSFTLSTEAQLLLTNTTCVNYTVGSSLRFATGGTNLTSLSALPAALTSTMVVSATATGTFIGIY